MRLLSFSHLKKATGYSLSGLKRAWQKEQAFRHETACFPLMGLALLLIQPGWLWAALLLSAWLMVLAFELLNTAIEEVFNYISPEYSKAAEHGKNLASAAIFIALCLNGLLWAAMLASRFI